MTAPTEEPRLRMSSRYASKNFTCSASGQKNGFRSTSSQFARALDSVIAHLDQRAAHRHTGHDFTSDRTGGNARGGFARRLAAAAAIVANAVFGVVGVIGVPRPVLILDVGIVLGALVDVVDH